MMGNSSPCISAGLLFSALLLLTDADLGTVLKTQLSRQATYQVSGLMSQRTDVPIHLWPSPDTAKADHARSGS